MSNSNSFERQTLRQMIHYDITNSILIDLEIDHYDIYLHRIWLIK